MPELAYVNGTFCNIQDAKVSIEDRGFQFADGVYEVILAHHARPFRLAEHLDRLRKSLDGIGLRIDLAEHRIDEVIREGIARSGFEHTMVYVQITRGVAPRSHVAPTEPKPTVVATFKPRQTPPPDLLAKGASVRTVPEIRWSWCHVKSIALLPNAIVKNEAVRDGFFDAIFVTPQGEVHEASAANVFVVRDGTVRTPPRSNAILHGVTRTYVLQCAADAGIPAEETRITLADLRQADEMFLSSTTMDIMPVTRLDDDPVGDGSVGTITRRLQEQFQQGIRGDVPE